jgi:plasmid maintenance system killer protein
MRYVPSLAVLIAVVASGCATGPTAGDAGPALAHNVYFALRDDSPAARDKLVADCYAYLRDHPGVTFFAAGRIVEGHAREVNVRDWHVGLHIVFASKHHHDLYQEAEDHHRFIEANSANWQSVRVFDTFVRE